MIPCKREPHMLFQQELAHFDPKIKSMDMLKTNSQIHELCDSQCLVGFCNQYGRGSYSFGGFASESFHSNHRGRSVISSTYWRGSKYCLPHKLPSFNRLMEMEHSIL